MIFVLDADNFFVSCEKLFEPKLNGKPAVVLSNNDGCIIARSIEVKALDIPMGIPYFQVKERIKQNNIGVFSGNFALYCDLSERIMAIARNFTDNLEVYSIDEAFGTFATKDSRDALVMAQALRAKILKETGISVSVGIAPTKTLAKIASHIVKNSKKAYVKEFHQLHGRFPYNSETEDATDSVCVLQNDLYLDKHLTETDVGEIWGIGRNLADRLHRLGITTCKKLKDAPFELVKKSLGINGIKTQKELRGEVCFNVSHKSSLPKSIMNTRSFGKVVTSRNELSEALTRYTADLSEKLRKNKVCTAYLTIFITTKRYDKHYYSKSVTIDFEEPTNSSKIMIEKVQKLLQSIFQPGFYYRKAGVIASGIIPQDSIPTNIFNQLEGLPTLIDKALDITNYRFGKGSILVSSAGVNPGWLMKTEIRSPRYTTSLKEIMKAV